jgi:urease accessory protein
MKMRAAPTATTTATKARSSRPERLAPVDLPEEFSVYEGERVRQLPVGETGKSGMVKLEFEIEGRTGQTVATDIFSKVPLQVQKVLYPEESFPEMAYVYIMSPSGGILQGDRLRVEISLKKGARVHVTTQAATKVYRMSANYATQDVAVFVDEGCYLELVPDQLIPYGDSRFHQRMTMRVHDDATMLYSEIVTPGRTGRGERFQYDIFSLKTIGLDQASRLRFLDALLLEPKRSSRPQDVFGGEREVFANLFVVTRSLGTSALCDSVYDVLEGGGRGSVRGGASALPGGDGISARLVARTAEELKRAVDGIVGVLRRDILGREFTGTRKY